jgi:predicted dehydrogenase
VEAKGNLSMDKVKVALFGVTHPHSKAHLKTLQLSEMVSGILLYDEDQEALNQVRNELGGGVSEAYTDLEEMLKKEEFDVGVADFKNHQNADLCLRLIEKGVHVISEKPITRSADELERVVTAADSQGLQLGVMYQNRYHPVSREARRLVQSGIIGRTTACEARLVTSQVKFRDPNHWLFDKSRSGGGILSWLGCHYIDLLCHVMDEDIMEVSAIVDTLSGEDIDVEDVATLSFRFRSGAMGSLQAGYQLAMSKPGYTGPTYDSYIGFRGAEGRLFWNPVEKPPTLQVESAMDAWKDAPARTFNYTLPELDCYGGAFGIAFLECFFRSAMGDGDPPASGRDALKVARVIEAAYESSDTGKRVRMQD